MMLAMFFRTTHPHKALISCFDGSELYAPYAWQFVVATMHPERSPAVLVVVLFWKEMEISGCEGFGSKSEAVETSKNQQPIRWREVTSSFWCDARLDLAYKGLSNTNCVELNCGDSVFKSKASFLAAPLGTFCCKGSLQAKVGSSGKAVFSDFSGKGSL